MLTHSCPQTMKTVPLRRPAREASASRAMAKISVMGAKLSSLDVKEKNVPVVYRRDLKMKQMVIQVNINTS